MGKKRKWTDEHLIEAVRSSKNYSEVLRILDLKLSGGSHAQVKLRVKQLAIETSHFTGQGWCVGEKHKKLVEKLKIPTKDILIKDSTFTSTHRLKKRLLKEGLLEEKCCICGIGPEWNGVFLSLQLDHKNGERTDNRIENLRILCPNCHSQTDSFAGKKKYRERDLNPHGITPNGF